MVKKPNLPHSFERKPQIGYQSHIFNRINELAAESPYRSRNEYLDACVQILDDMELFSLKHELCGLLDCDEIGFLASLLKHQDVHFYPDPRYKSLIKTKIDDVLALGNYNKELAIDQVHLVAKLTKLTEFQTYVLMITIIKAWNLPHQTELSLFESLKPNDCGYLILEKSSIPLLNADRMAGRNPVHNNEYIYVLGKKYSLESAQKFIDSLEQNDQDADLFTDGQYVVFDVKNDAFIR